LFGMVTNSHIIIAFSNKHSEFWETVSSMFLKTKTQTHTVLC
jgi:hypothetical protein